MSSIVYHAPWDVRFEERQVDNRELEETEVLVEIRATGVCGTDLNIIAGGYEAAVGPVVLGHESTGVIAAVGPSVTSVVVGDRVHIDPTYSCGICRLCRTERPNHCLNKVGTEAGVTADGTMAPFYRTGERFVYRMDDSLSFHEGTLAEPLSCALTGVRKLALRKDTATCILGGGPMGILYAHALALAGLQGTVCETVPDRHDLLAPALPSGWAVASSLAEASETCEHEFDLIVDTSSVMTAQAADAVARGGQVMVVGLRSVEQTIDPSILADRSVSLIGSIDSIGTFAEAVSLLGRGALPTEHIVTHRVPMPEWQSAIGLLGMSLEDQARTGHTTGLKVVIEAGH